MDTPISPLDGAAADLELINLREPPSGSRLVGETVGSVSVVSVWGAGVVPIGAAAAVPVSGAGLTGNEVAAAIGSVGGAVIGVGSEFP